MRWSAVTCRPPHCPLPVCCERDKRVNHLAVLSPLVLAADLLLFLGCEIILNVECLADLIGGLALDHVGNGLATYIKESLDIEVICGLRAPVSNRWAVRVNPLPG